MTKKESTVPTLCWGYAGIRGMFQTGGPVDPPPSRPEVRNKTNLILNYLPQDMTESELHRLFSKYGEIRKAKVIRHRDTGISCCYGFVDFVSERQAAAAVYNLNGYETRGKRLKVAFARPTEYENTNLYVANLPTYMDEKKIRELFAPYGKLLDVTLLRHRFNNKFRGVAFLDFELARDAEEAKYGMDRYMIKGAFKPLKVKFVERAKSGPTSHYRHKDKSSTPPYKRRQRTYDHHGSKRFRDSD
ncbi:sex-lethal homolog [Drosophila simulans]|uniref:GD19030 n=1 Tax=Drosophila simulans TaxID=7240 RepID=B4QYF9_DROSI|nr:sex-lethal homolog [Drosophila simulans]EDX12804.1 GD19030 [Drosophila simulans]KMZ03372.1 uncharacterized protein Dsimw501_GD19030 [Drosophila simulans]